MGPKNLGCHVAASGHLPPPGIRGKITLKGRRTGLRRLKDKGAGRDWVSGAGRALQNPRTGERTRPLRERGGRRGLQGPRRRG